MTQRTFVVAIAVALLATLVLPVASAHWRTTSAPTDWEKPHEHEFFLHSDSAPSIYSGTFQRMCLDGTSLTWGTQQGCPPPGAVTPPVRGLSLGGINCVDLDSVGTTTYVKNEPRTTLGISAVTIDWGASALGPGVDGNYNLADHFAHPVRSTSGGVQGDAANPTGGSVAHYPSLVSTAPGVVQTSIVQIGLGALGTGSSSSTMPGVDTGDNDPEVCRGGAIMTYAIDSGVAKRVKVGGAVTALDGAGSGLNDPLGIGGDCVYDVVVCSPVVNTGASVPRSSSVPVGVLLSPSVQRDVSEPIPYSVCHSLPGAGCTNIPTSGTQARLGNAAGENGVYSSSQDCVWIGSEAGRTHAGSGRVYRGVQALWGTSTPTGNACWPERLVRSSAPVTAIYLPSSQALESAAGAADGTWAPDQLAATNSGVESISIFVDTAEMRNFHNFHSGCDTGTPVAGSASCFNPTVDPPTAWFAAPNSLHSFVAVFQP